MYDGVGVRDIEQIQTGSIDIPSPRLNALLMLRSMRFTLGTRLMPIGATSSVWVTWLAKPCRSLRRRYRVRGSCAGTARCVRFARLRHAGVAAELLRRFEKVSGLAALEDRLDEIRMTQIMGASARGSASELTSDLRIHAITFSRIGVACSGSHSDNRPLIGPTTIEGVYVLGALSGFGIMGSQAAAELLAAYLLDVPLPDYAAAYHPARFDDAVYQRILATVDSKSGQL